MANRVTKSVRKKGNKKGKIYAQNNIRKIKSKRVPLEMKGKFYGGRFIKLEMDKISRMKRKKAVKEIADRTLKP